jgi:hypothetical protein
MTSNVFVEVLASFESQLAHELEIKPDISKLIEINGTNIINV